jgi:DNA-binding GntR family transcriptional regulator
MQSDVEVTYKCPQRKIMRMKDLPETKRQAVQPIVDPKAIEQVRTLLRNRSRDLLLFNLALETGLPANEMLQLLVKDLNGLQVGDEIPVSPARGHRHGPVKLGPKTQETFQRYVSETSPRLDDYLFKSRKGNGPLSLSSASRLVSSWFENAGLREMSGFLSLRKTWEVHRLSHAAKKEDPLPLGREQASYSVNLIQPISAQELAYKQLESAIVTARIKPGERLVTQELARQMGVSRIPIREAIGRLEARNFVTVQPNKGIIVNELSEKNLREILEIRLMLELSASAKAVSRGDSSTVHRLENFNMQYMHARAKNDADEALRVNQEFHFAIYREAGMPILLSMIETLWNQVSPYYHLMFRQTLFRDPETGHDHHQKMIEGMRGKDSQKVSHWLKVDLVESTEFVISVMRSMKNESPKRM